MKIRQSNGTYTGKTIDCNNKSTIGSWKRRSPMPSAQMPSARTQLPTPPHGACNNCLKPISKNFNTSTSATNASINNKQLQKQHNSHNNKFTIKHLIIFTKQHNNDILLMEIEYGKE